MDQEQFKCKVFIHCLCTVQRLSVKDNKGKHFVCAMNKVLTFKLANRDYLFD